MTGDSDTENVIETYNRDAKRVKGTSVGGP